MMGLQEHEKVAGRAWRDRKQAEFDALPPVDHLAPLVVAQYRHECGARADVSTPIELREVYVLSPAMAVTDKGEVWIDGDGPAPESAVIILPGRLAWVYREGKCKGRCGATARSKSGRIVDAWVRSPLN